MNRNIEIVVHLVLSLKPLSHNCPLSRFETESASQLIFREFYFRNLREELFARIRIPFGVIFLQRESSRADFAAHPHVIWLDCEKLMV